VRKVSGVENTCLTAVNVYSIVYNMLNNEDSDGIPVEVDEDEGETEALPYESMAQLVWSVS
jgi:hypothetical protein